MRRRNQTDSSMLKNFLFFFDNYKKNCLFTLGSLLFKIKKEQANKHFSYNYIYCATFYLDSISKNKISRLQIWSLLARQLARQTGWYLIRLFGGFQTMRKNFHRVKDRVFVSFAPKRYLSQDKPRNKNLFYTTPQGLSESPSYKILGDRKITFTDFGHFYRLKV